MWYISVFNLRYLDKYDVCIASCCSFFAEWSVDSACAGCVQMLNSQRVLMLSIVLLFDVTNIFRENFNH